MYEDRFQNIRTQLTEAQVQSPPEPWKLVSSISVGGLTHVGYVNDSDLCLVVSHQGRGVFDCLTGERLARDDEAYPEGLDWIKLRSPGIGPLANDIIRIAGLSGGGLPQTTKDGWRLEVASLPWPLLCVFLSQPNKFIVDGLEGSTKISDGGVCEIRAYGFSDTGKTFVVASSCDLDIFRRDDR